ncbi:unnamed protein product, partial [Amoebophrya sp. A25]
LEELRDAALARLGRCRRFEAADAIELDFLQALEFVARFLERTAKASISGTIITSTCSALEEAQQTEARRTALRCFQDNVGALVEDCLRRSISSTCREVGDTGGDGPTLGMLLDIHPGTDWFCQRLAAATKEGRTVETSCQGVLGEMNVSAIRYSGQELVDINIGNVRVPVKELLSNYQTCIQAHGETFLQVLAEATGEWMSGCVEETRRLAEVLGPPVFAVTNSKDDVPAEIKGSVRTASRLMEKTPSTRGTLLASAEVLSDSRGATASVLGAIDHDSADGVAVEQKDDLRNVKVDSPVDACSLVDADLPRLASPLQLNSAGDGLPRPFSVDSAAPGVVIYSPQIATHVRSVLASRGTNASCTGVESSTSYRTLSHSPGNYGRVSSSSSFLHSTDLWSLSTLDRAKWIHLFLSERIECAEEALAEAEENVVQAKRALRLAETRKSLHESTRRLRGGGLSSCASIEWQSTEDKKCKGRGDLVVTCMANDEANALLDKLSVGHVGHGRRGLATNVMSLASISSENAFANPDCIIVD